MIGIIIACLDRLAPAFARRDTKVWFGLFIIGMMTRRDTAGVTSMVRSLGVQSSSYDAFLNMLEGRSIDFNKLVASWVNLVLSLNENTIVRINSRIVLVGDGLKVGKEAKRMPAVKSLHQESNNNSKPEHIMGHSFQVLSVLLGRDNQPMFATPLTSRIHEGIKLTNRDKRTLQEKYCEMLAATWEGGPAYLVLDSYYSCGYLALFCSQDLDIHIVTRADRSVVAYEPPASKEGRGRPRKYGDKVKLMKLFSSEKMTETTLPLYGEANAKVEYWTRNLIWRPFGGLIRFVGVKYPGSGTIILMTTDLTLAPEDIIRLYSFRMKIDVSFKPAVHTVGTYAYHHWTKEMPKIKRGAGNQHLHRTSPSAREQIMLKLRQCEMHVACGIVAQGLLQHLALHHSDSVWASFRGWVRTIRPNLPPSEAVVLAALQHEYLDYLLTVAGKSDLEKKLIEILDPGQLSGIGVLQETA